MRRLLFVLAALSGCSSSSGQCGPGTVRHGYACYPTDPTDLAPPVITVDPPVRTYAVGTVRLTSDEPATIYYTTDGTAPTTASANEPNVVVIPNMPDDATVSFFGVDLNGNTSAIQTVHWQIDRTGPGTPRDFKLVAAGDMKTLTWTPPADQQLRGVLLARVVGPLTFSPERGKAYYPGTQLAPGVTAVAVIGAGLSGTFSESHATMPIGMARYAIWAYDDLYNYGSPANAYALDTLPAQTGSLTANAGTGVVSVSSPMPNVTITGTATLNSDLEITLSITNATSRPLFAPKLVVTNTLSVGSLSNYYDVIDTFPYYQLGGGIDAGATTKLTILVSGVSNTDTVALDLELRQNPVFAATAWTDHAGSVTDEVTNQSIQELAAGYPGLVNVAGVHGGGITPDGQLIAGARNSSAITSFDIATGARTLTARLAEGKSAAPRVTLDPTGGTGYALVVPGHLDANRQSALVSQLVRFDTATLQETGRLDIGISKNREIVISPDGKLAVIATGIDGPIPIVDLDTFTLRTLPDSGETRGATFTADSNTLVVIGRQATRLVNPYDGTLIKTIAMPTPWEKTFHSAFGPDGRLWIGRDTKLVALDVTTAVGTAYDIESAVMEIIGGKIYAGGEGNTGYDSYDTTGTSVGNQLNFNDDAYGHWIGHTSF